MKKPCLKLFALVLSFGAMVCAQAQTVGYVDLERVTAKAGSVTQAVRDATDQMNEMQRKIQDKTRALQDIDVQLKRDDGVLSADRISEKRAARTKLENELYDLDRDMRVKERSLETDVFVPLKRNILYAIQDVAKSRKIDLVIPAKDILYGSTSADLTNDVIVKLGATGGKEPSATPSSTSDSKKSDDLKKQTSESSKAADPVSSPTDEQTTDSVADAKPATDSGAAAPAADNTGAFTLAVPTDNSASADEHATVVTGSASASASADAEASSKGTVKVPTSSGAKKARTSSSESKKN